MTPTLFLNLLGLLVCIGLGLANPISRMEEVIDVTAPSEDTEDSLQPLDEIRANDYILKQQHDIEETTPDLEELATNDLEDHNEILDRMLGDSEELGKDEVVEQNDSESEHGVVKRDVEEDKEEEDEKEVDDEVSEEEEQDEVNWEVFWPTRYH